MLPARHRSRRRRAGFTLVELMAVVVITGILASLAVVMVRSRIYAAKSNRALVGMQAIRAAEEAFRAHNGRYLDCSSSAGQPKWYPMQQPGSSAYDWRQPDHDDWTRWQALGVIRLAPTQYGFLANAGIAGQAYPTLHTTKDPALPLALVGGGGGTGAPADWYVIQAKGDLDGDGVFFQGIVTSTTASVYVEGEAE